MKKLPLKVFLALLMVSAIAAFFIFDLGKYVSLPALKEKEQLLRNFYYGHPYQLMAIFLVVYVASVALSLPVATVLALGGGAVFGFWLGTFLVSVASTIGATLAFWVSRFILHDWVQKHFGDKLGVINEGIKREGAFYLFTLRLVPLFPFFVINLVMALTPVKSLTFFFVSQIAMLPGTMAYVNAGTQLSKIDSGKDIMSWPVILSFAILGLLPLVAKKTVEWLRRR